MNGNKPNSLEELLKKTSEKMGINKENLKNSPQNQAANLLKNLDPQNAKKVEQILSDKAATEKLLSTTKAQQLLKKLLGEK